MTITNTDDIIDSREVIARIDELISEREAWIEEVEENSGQFDMSPAVDWHNANTEEGLELDALLELQEEASSSPDWIHGEALIRDSYFEQYAEDLANDIGAVDSDASWPTCHIDWEAAAEALQVDYMSVDFDGVQYWIRA